MWNVEVQIASEPSHGTVAVRVRLRLTAREIGRVFVGGDVLVQLPTNGVVIDEGAAPIPRTGIFLSELAEEREGFVRRFTDQASADAYAASVSEQLDALQTQLSGSDTG